MVTKSLYSIPIPVPPLSEQQRIVALLDAEFAKIDALKANAEKNLQNAKDLYNEVLKRELMPHNTWNSQTLDDVCTKIVDGTHNSPVNSSKGDYMYVTAKKIGDLTFQTLPMLQAKYIVKFMTDAILKKVMYCTSKMVQQQA